MQSYYYMVRFPNFKGYGAVLRVQSTFTNPDSKVHGANMGPIWGQQDPDGSHVGLMNFAI